MTSAIGSLLGGSNPLSSVMNIASLVFPEAAIANAVMNIGSQIIGDVVKQATQQLCQESGMQAATIPPEVDVLVVGGGINGTGIARDLAGRALSVLLCEQHDLASHTSSSSTKLIHGGLRYLEHYEFSLVRKALAEREVLLRSAPHIMRR